MPGQQPAIMNSSNFPVALTAGRERQGLRKRIQWQTTQGISVTGWPCGPRLGRSRACSSQASSINDPVPEGPRQVIVETLSCTHFH